MVRVPLWSLVAVVLVGCGDDEASSTSTGGASSSTSSGSNTTSASSSDVGSSGTGTGGAGEGASSGTGGDGEGAGGSAPLAADGAPCGSHDDCEGGVCLLEAVTGHPGGMCGSACLPDDPSTCDGVCVGVDPFGRVCHATCTLDDASCRDAYACQIGEDEEAGHCVPGCETDADCPGTGLCDEGSGDCILPEVSCEDLLDDNGDDRVDCADPSCAGDEVCQVGQGALGSPCTRHSDCASAIGMPLCLSEAATGYPGGACGQYCETTIEGIGPAECPGGFALCRPSLVFTEDAGGSDPIRHCPLGACGDSTPCREGYSCCDQPGCLYEMDTCIVGCTDSAQCVDTSNECSSPQAGWPALCSPPEPVEICDNGIDDNDDYEPDCDDDECEVACEALAADLCAGAPDLAPSQSGETEPGPGIGKSCLHSDVHGEVSPRVYRYVAAATGTLSLTLESVFPQTVSVVTGCDLQTTTPVACDKDDDYDGLVEVSAEVAGGVTYHVLVWAIGPGHEGAFELTSEAP